MLENPMYLVDPPEPEPCEEEGREANEPALDREPECNCHFSGDQADASDCDLHGGNR